MPTLLHHTLSTSPSVWCHFSLSCQYIPPKYLAPNLGSFWSITDHTYGKFLCFQNHRDGKERYVNFYNYPVEITDLSIKPHGFFWLVWNSFASVWYNTYCLRFPKNSAGFYPHSCAGGKNQVSVILGKAWALAPALRRLWRHQNRWNLHIIGMTTDVGTETKSCFQKQ